MTGLNTPFQGGFVKDVAERVIKWAKVRNLNNRPMLLLLLIVVVVGYLV
jgi:hypothetical protein